MPHATTYTLPAKGDKKSFDKLFVALYPRLTAYASLFLDREAAEDVVQELFAYLWENSEKLTIHTSTEAYLFKAVYQRCLNQLKHRKFEGAYHQQIEERLSSLEQQAFDPETNESVRKLFMSDLKHDMRQAIDELPDRCREVFMLSYVYQLKNKEIAEVLDISVNTVENHIANALKKLRLKLKKYMCVLELLLMI